MKLTKLISLIIQLGRPVHLIGEPGIGKTAFIQEIARKLDYHLETIIAANHEPSDITGLPAVAEIDGMPIAEFLAIPMIRNILEKAKEGIPTLFFLDEISTAPPAMQAACLRLLHERMAGSIELPASTLFALASNPTGTSAGVFMLTGAMANRMYHFNWKADAQIFQMGMIQGFDKAEILMTPNNWEQFKPEARTIIASYIGVNETQLLKQPKESSNQAGPWPSPRTWEIASEGLAAILALNLSEDEINETLLPLFSAIVGEGTALEFMAWYDHRDLKKPQEYLKDPDKIKLPERSDQIFATLNSIVSYLINKENIKRPEWKAAWTILGRVAENGQADFAAIPARLLVRNRPKGFQVPPAIAKFIPALSAAGLVEK